MDTTSIPTPTVDPAVWTALDGAAVILTPTHRHAPPATLRANRVAAALAARTGAALHLADRTGVTWADTPHVDRPDLDEPHLARSAEHAYGLGVADVVALRPSMPDLEGLEAALFVSGADVLVVPEKLDHVGLILRAELGRSPVAVLRERAAHRPVVLVGEHGAARLAA